MSKLLELSMVKEFAEAIELDVALVTQTFAIKAHVGVVKRTPVDEGRARANWQIGIGTIPGKTTTTDKQPLGSDPGIPADVAKIDGTKIVYISNSLDYIVPLEDGSSKQAPQGMAALTMAELQGEIDAAL